MYAAQSALQGFPWVDPFRLFHPETLHQDHQGIGRRLVEHLKGLLSAAQLKLVNDHLLQTDPFPGQAIHSKGLLANGLTAHKAYCMLQRLGAAVLTLARDGKLEEPLKKWLEALTRAPPSCQRLPHALHTAWLCWAWCVALAAPDNLPCCACSVPRVADLPRQDSAHPHHHPAAATSAEEVLLPCDRAGGGEHCESTNSRS